jgi:hypothetical protein
VDLHVVTGVGHDHEVLAHHVEQAARELGASGPTGEHDDWSGHGTEAIG